MKKTVLLTIALLLGVIVPQRVCAYDLITVTSAGQTLYFNVNGTYLTVTSGPEKPTGDLVIPSMIISSGTRHIVTAIGNYAFYDCTGLTSVTIPSSVTSIGNHAFCDCTSLTSVSIPSSVTSIGNYAFCDCTSLTSVSIPSSVTSIGYYAFSGCTGLTSVSIPSSVTSIGDYAFSSCTGLTSVSIPSSVTSIGGHAFFGCTGLTSVTIPSSVTSIGNYAFCDCTSLTSVSIPSSVTSIGDHAFFGCTGLTSVTIPSSVTSIGNYTFCDCTSLTSVSIPSSVTSIGDYAFSSCTGLTSVSIPSSVTIIGDHAFFGCTGLTSVTIPSSVTSIGNYAFCDCTSLTSVTIPSSVTSIGNYAFYGCTGLTSVTIPSSVTSIGYHAFSGCTGLTSVTMEGNTPPVLDNSYVFGGTAEDLTITIPCGTLSAYQNAWGTSYNFVSTITRSGVTTIKACDSYTWPLNGVTYTENPSVTPTARLVNAASDGCDSLVTLNLSFGPGNVAIEDQNAYTDQFLWGYSYYKYSLSEQIYRREELGGEKNLTAMEVKFSSFDHIRDISIYLGHTDQNSVENWIRPDDLTLVWSGNEDFNDNVWNVIVFDNPFHYNGDDNLLLVIVDNTGAWEDHPDNYVYTHYNPGLKSMYMYSDNTVFDVDTLPTRSGSTTYERINVYWHYNCGPYEETEERTICDSQLPYTWNGVVFTEAGTQQTTLDNGNTLQMTLHVATKQHSYTEVTNCGPYTWRLTGQTYNKSGLKFNKGTTPEGCPIRDTLMLTIIDRYHSYTEVENCGPYTWDKTGQTYNKSGLKFYKGTANDGCPIRDTLKLTVTDRIHSYTEVTSCGPYTWQLTGQTYNKSGLKFNKGTTPDGCLIRDTLKLTVTDRIHSYTEVTNCGPYTWDVTGQTYNKSGLKFNKGVTSDGCLIRDTLKLTVVDRWSSHDTVVSCDGTYTWDKTGQTYKKTGMKFFKGTANDGCPIRDTLYVIISQKEHSYTEVTNCGPYTWDLTGQTYNKSGLKFYKGTNEYGCPVRDTLNLTVLNCKGNGDADSPSQLSTLNSQLSMYPNPTSGLVYIEVKSNTPSSTLNSQLTIEVLDLVGRRVAMFENTNTLDLSHLADGTYTLRITMPEGVALRKVVKK